MHHVFQTNFNPGTHPDPGNCWQAQIASLLNLPLDAVPNFVAFGDDCWKVQEQFLLTQGYRYVEYLRNPRALGSDGNFQEVTDRIVYHLEGIDGYFSAVVWSPKYFTLEAMCDWDQVQPQHAVIIDRHFNVVHDPNPNNSDVKEYPLSKILGWNGVLGIDVIEKIKS